MFSIPSATPAASAGKFGCYGDHALADRHLDRVEIEPLNLTEPAQIAARDTPGIHYLDRFGATVP